MANEITHNLRVQLANGSLRFDFNPGRLQVDQATQLLFDSTQSIATSEATIALTGVSTPRLIILHNLDATNYVEAGFVTTVYGLRLRPSAVPSCFEINTSITSLFLRANTAACRVRIIAINL
jgi:hypothetical protein